MNTCLIFYGNFFFLFVCLFLCLCRFSKPIFACISLLISSRNRREREREELFHGRQDFNLFLTPHNCAISAFFVTNYFLYHFIFYLIFIHGSFLRLCHTIIIINNCIFYICIYLYFIVFKYYQEGCPK